MSAEKYPRLKTGILLLSLILSSVSIYFTYNFYSSNLQLQYSSRRADLSLLVSSAYPATKGNVSLNLRGIINNEGSRTSIIKEIRVGLLFNPIGATSTQIVYTYSGAIYAYLGWNNSLFQEKETKNLFVYFSVPNSLNLTSPSSGFITIKHDDGISIQEQTYKIEFTK